MWPLQRCISDGMVQTQSKRVKSSCVNCLTFQVACRHSSECPSVAHSSSGRLVSFRSRSNGSSSHLKTCWGGFRQKSAQGSLFDFLTVALLAGPKPRRHTAGSVFNVSRMPSSKIAWRLQKGEQENVLHKAFWKFLKAKFLAHCTEYTHSLGKPREAYGGREAQESSENLQSSHWHVQVNTVASHQLLCKPVGHSDLPESTSCAIFLDPFFLYVAADCSFSIF